MAGRRRWSPLMFSCVDGIRVNSNLRKEIVEKSKQSWISRAQGLLQPSRCYVGSSVVSLQLPGEPNVRLTSCRFPCLRFKCLCQSSPEGEVWFLVEGLQNGWSAKRPTADKFHTELTFITSSKNSTCVTASRFTFKTFSSVYTCTTSIVSLLITSIVKWS